MRRLGHERFAVVGHERGSYVASRLAMDHPEAVERLAVLDSVPIGEALTRTDARFATDWWHWFFFAQTGVPERVITADPDAWYGTGPERLASTGEGNYADYLTAIRDPATVRAMLEVYRAGLGIDRAADDADRSAGRRLACPTLVAWSTDDDMENLYGDVLAVRLPCSSELREVAVPSGHHMGEQAPEQLAAALLSLLDPRPAACPVAVRLTTHRVDSVRVAALLPGSVPVVFQRPSPSEQVAALHRMGSGALPTVAAVVQERTSGHQQRA